MRILANDGIDPAGKEALEAAGFEVLTVNVAQEQLANYINDQSIRVLFVRSATKVRKELLDACPELRLIGRGGVGLDNIDVAYAKQKGIPVINTPEASSESVADLVFAHLLGGYRFLHQANRDMPLEGESRFKTLKKAYSKGKELKGRTLGIIGFGQIGQAVARRALALGMQVVYSDPNQEQVRLELDFAGGQSIAFELEHQALEDVLAVADVISLHTPAQSGYLLGSQEFKLMKPGAVLINTARGGLVDEGALLDALDEEILDFAALDVFEQEPAPAVQLLMHPKLSLSPHIGAATEEAQARIGLELAEKTIALLKS